MRQSRGRARLGLLVPFTNTNFEPDMALMSPPGISLHAARLGGYDADEIPDAAQMHGLGASEIDTPLSLLLGARPDVVLYGCTSATLTHGPAFDRALTARIAAHGSGKCVTAAGALVHALGALEIQRFGFASPYVPQINEMAIGFLESSGLRCAARADFGETLDNTGQGALRPDAVFELGCRADGPKVQAIVLSCTDMRSVETLAALEAHLGKPVISSNQAMLYQALGLLGIKEPVPGFGKLLEGEMR